MQIESTFRHSHLVKLELGVRSKVAWKTSIVWTSLALEALQKFYVWCKIEFRIAPKRQLLSNLKTSA